MELNRNEVDRLSEKDLYFCDRKSVIHNSKGRTLSPVRFNKAQEQYQLSPVSEEKILSFCEEFITKTGIPFVARFVSDTKNIYYDDGTIWAKRAKNGHIVVVGYGKVNFDIPPSTDNYDDLIDVPDSKDPDSKKKLVDKWNTPGILLHHVGGKYDETKVLVLQPRRGKRDILKEYRKKYGEKYGDLKVIKRAFGNYLSEECKVPIIDCYNNRITEVKNYNNMQNSL